MIDTVEMLEKRTSTCSKCFEDKLLGNDGKRHIVICGGTGCLSNNSKEIKKKFEKRLEERFSILLRQVPLLCQRLGKLLEINLGCHSLTSL